MNAQPELNLATTGGVEIVEINGAELDALLERCEQQGRLVAVVQVVGISSYRCTVVSKRVRKEGP